jgi:hypothetical protein
MTGSFFVSRLPSPFSKAILNASVIVELVMSIRVIRFIMHIEFKTIGLSSRIFISKEDQISNIWQKRSII